MFLFKQWKVVVGVTAAAGCLLQLWFSLSVYPHNSDHYFFPRVAQNLVEHDGEFSNWLLMSAPRYVPDLLINVISFAAVGSGLVGLALADVLLVLLQGYAVCLLAWRCGADMGTALLAGLTYCAGCVIAGAHYTSLSYIAWHAGTFAMILICLGLSIRPAGSHGMVGALVLVILTTLATASNPLAIPLLMVGMGVVSLIRLLHHYRTSNHLLRFRGWWWNLLMPLGLTALGCTLGTLTYRFLLPYPFSNPVKASGLSMERILDPVVALRATMDAILSLAAESVFLVALALVAVTLAVFRRGALFVPMCTLTGFWLVTSVANQGMIELGAFNAPRYRIMPINGSIAVAGICVALIAARWRFRFVVPIMALGLMAWTHVDMQPAYEERYRKLLADARCLAEHVENFAEARHTTASQLAGIGDISATKGHPYLSDGRLRLIATRGTNPHLMHLMQDVSLLQRTPVYVIARMDNEKKRFTGASYPNILTEQRAVDRYGDPTASHPCLAYMVMFYPDGLQLPPKQHWPSSIRQ